MCFYDIFHHKHNDLFFSTLSVYTIPNRLCKLVKGTIKHLFYVIYGGWYFLAFVYRVVEALLQSLRSLNHFILSIFTLVSMFYYYHLPSLTSCPSNVHKISQILMAGYALCISSHNKQTLRKINVELFIDGPCKKILQIWILNWTPFLAKIFSN